MNPAPRNQYFIWCDQPIMPTSSPPANDSQASVFKIWVHLTRITAPSSTACRSCRRVFYCACGRMRNQSSSATSARNSQVTKPLEGRWTAALGLRSAMEDYFVSNRAGYAFPRAISIFRNPAWRLLILEMWSSAYRIVPDVG